jgi:hypothetical protein
MADKDKVDFENTIVRIDTLEDGTRSFDNEFNDAFLRSLTKEQFEELQRRLDQRIHELGHKQ